MRVAVLGMLAAATLPFALCTPARAQGKVPDPCAVVSKAEIEQTFGVKLQSGQKDQTVPGTGVLLSCMYQGVGGSAQIGISVRQDPPEVRANEKTALKGLNPRAIAGVGTDAFLIDVGFGVQVTAYRGPRDAVQVMASSVGTDAKATEAGLVKIAKLMLDRWK